MFKFFILAVLTVNAIRIRDDLPYNDEEDDISLPQLGQLVAAEQKAEEKESESAKTELDGTSIESSGNSSIDDAASAFVDSDESLNAQIEEENKYKAPLKSGYPYDD